MAVVPSDFEDKAFVQAYLDQATDANVLSRRFVEDNVTINLTQLVLNLHRWLKEAENKISAGETEKAEASRRVEDAKREADDRKANKSEAQRIQEDALKADSEKASNSDGSSTQVGNPNSIGASNPATEDAKPSESAPLVIGKKV